MAKIRTLTLVFFLAAGATVFSLEYQAYAVPCDAIVGKWTWFTGGVATVNPDGTMVYANPDGTTANDGSWECTDPSRGMFTLRWRIGGYVNSLTLSADGQGLSSTDPSQWYVKATRIGTYTKADDARGQSPTGYIQSLNAKVTSLRFFESGYDPPPREQRVYSDRFDKSKTRYVNWELNLEFPASGNRRSFVIEQLWYRADGSLLARQAVNPVIEPNWTWYYQNHSYGWNDPGNWSDGSYRVDLYVDAQKVASGSFEIYTAAPVDNYFSRGLDYFNKGMYDEAIAEFNKSIELNPNNVHAYNNRGAAYGNKGQHDYAITDYTKAIELNPKYARAYSNRCASYIKKKFYDQAISDCTKAIEIDPNYADAYNNRGLGYAGKGLYDQAISDYNKAIELNPKYTSVYYNRGLAYGKKKLYDQAISDYTKAIELNPNNSEYYFQRGLVYDDKKLHDKAAADYTKVIEINPKDTDAYINRSLAYHDLGEYKKSLPDLNKAIELEPDLAEAYDMRADIHDHLGDYDSALKDLGKAQDLGYEVDQDFFEEMEILAGKVQPAEGSYSPDVVQLVERISKNYKDTVLKDLSFDTIEKGLSVGIAEGFKLIVKYLECDAFMVRDYKSSEEFLDDCNKNLNGLEWKEKMKLIYLAEIVLSSIKLSETDKGASSSESSVYFDYKGYEGGIDQERFFEEGVIDMHKGASGIKCINRNACEQTLADLKKLVETAEKSTSAGKGN